MTPESRAYEALRPVLQGLYLDPQRIENVTTEGTPDCNYTMGWIEGKWLEAWPVRRLTRVDVGIRPEQNAFLTRRWMSGGPCWVHLRVGKESFLFAGLDSREIKAGRTQDELRRMAVWTGKTDVEWLRAWLTWDADRLPICQRARLLRLQCNATIEQASKTLSWKPCDIELGETTDTTKACDLIDAWLG